MARRAGSADLPLHGGHVPKWLADRMTRLGAVMSEAIVHHYGRDELLRRPLTSWSSEDLRTPRSRAARSRCFSYSSPVSLANSSISFCSPASAAAFVAGSDFSSAQDGIQSGDCSAS